MLAFDCSSTPLFVSRDDSDKGVFFVVEENGQIWAPRFSQVASSWSKAFLLCPMRLVDLVDSDGFVQLTEVVHMRERGVFVWVQRVSGADTDTSSPLFGIVSRRITAYDGAKFDAFLFVCPDCVGLCFHLYSRFSCSLHI